VAVPDDGVTDLLENVRRDATAGAQPMHDDEFTRMSTEGFTSQLAKLDKRFGLAA
jgi:hypothetical protein